METIVLKVDPTNPEPEMIRRAAETLRAGRLVAFPTETVYGLGANAMDANAVARIFEAKGRPATNPLIVHVSDVSEVPNVAGKWPETAMRLAARFWPGPLTLVVPKGEAVPDIVTARGPTVAVRCPNHTVARALIRAAGVPLAAPSANRSTELSPTRAEHVLKGLNGRIDLVLDGGPCPGGIESTVLDVTGDTPRLLRPGLVTLPMLEEVCGKVEVASRGCEPMGSEPSRSPGRMAKHYSPRTRLRLTHWNDMLEDSIEERQAGRKVGSIHFCREDALWDEVLGVSGRLIRLPADPEHAAALLYDALHRLDQSGVDLILVERPPDTPEWAAVRDRLMRAASSS